MTEETKMGKNHIKSDNSKQISQITKDCVTIGRFTVSKEPNI